MLNTLVCQGVCVIYVLYNISIVDEVTMSSTNVFHSPDKGTIKFQNVGEQWIFHWMTNNYEPFV